MKKKLNIKGKIAEFRAWQKRPRKVAANTSQEHECLNCHDHFTGKFCPRCGQAATTARFSMRVAASNFMDAYGMGERGMFRTLRDLILRPGYLILDYLRGMRTAYYAPFKLFFLLTALSLLVTHGGNIKGINHAAKEETEIVAQQANEQSEEKKDSATDVKFSVFNDKQVDERVVNILNKTMKGVESLQRRYSSIFMLLTLMFLSGYLYLFFRRSPNIPDMRYAEFFIALLYTTNMYTVYTIVFDFFYLDNLSFYSIFLTLIPLKQMSGYGWLRTIVKTAVATVSMFFLAMVLFFAAVILVVKVVEWFG